MEVDDDFDDYEEIKIAQKKKKFSSSVLLPSTSNNKEDFFQMNCINNDEVDNESDSEKKIKKKAKKKKTKSKSKKKEKSNLKNINQEYNNNDIINNKEKNRTKVQFMKEEKEKNIKENNTNNNIINNENYIKKLLQNSNLSEIDKFGLFICIKIVNEIIKILKIIYLYKKIRLNQEKASSKIISLYKAYIFRKQFKYNYLILKIINLRNENISKIIANYRGYYIRKNLARILEKKEDNYIIYSTLCNNKMIYFKIKYDDNFEDNLYFEYNKVLKCFLFYLSHKERSLSRKKISGFFYNERYHKLTDDLYLKNEKGENVINFPEIIEKNENNIDKYDKIINEFMKDNRYKKKKMIYTIDEYEDSKRKAMDDDIIFDKKKNNSEKLDKFSRSKSYMRLKGMKKNKSILKPSKSYIALKSGDKKIQFGKAKVLGYLLNKKFLS